MIPYLDKYFTEWADVTEAMSTLTGYRYFYKRIFRFFFSLHFQKNPVHTRGVHEYVSVPMMMQKRSKMPHKHARPVGGNNVKSASHVKHHRRTWCTY